MALDLFAKQGYEKTSLREIAEQLDVTKAALYYHFKTKEDIVLSLFRDLSEPLDELIAWGERQPRALETKQELLRRYSAALTGVEPLLRFMQENQATVRELSIGQFFKDRMIAMSGLIRDPDAGLTDQVRCTTALFSIHASLFAMQKNRGRPRGEAASRPRSRPRSPDPGARASGTPGRPVTPEGDGAPPAGLRPGGQAGGQAGGQILTPCSRRKVSGPTAEP
ncbi:putative TetR-family transcriptional regulator [Streptomyces himastatinicus ATCC 53653]|uniref:Putative TetR-family transcriptional regulator n=1 Tax=Streptomyces himastatinicus ATCC 53653 TaxID=457427 RepID=D9WSY6_9ACTN|nr:putative TetR-family transcriptional regulator [Streptomyces himastatinicus ATCC 53653]